MIVLGIETSCDETAASVVEGAGNSVKVLSNVVSSQIEIHKKYGGVIPEVAAREHVLNILPVINEAITYSPLIKGTGGIRRQVDAIAVTTGPGLITSLIAGVETAKTLAYAWNIPTIAINHIEGHIYANFIQGQHLGKNNNQYLVSSIRFPAIILTVSGGHTMLILMEGHGKLKIIGDTRDDAAGEAFDKAAKLLGIGYPGGPAIAAEAAKYRRSASGGQYPVSQYQVNLPRPMIAKNNFDFSFSGLKTALLCQIQKDKNVHSHISIYCSEFQQAVIDVLIYKTIKATKKFNAKTVMLAGGVSANLELRKQLEQAVFAKLENTNFHLPDLAYTTDNAAMVASAGYFAAKQKKFTPWSKLKADPNLSL